MNIADGDGPGNLDLEEIREVLEAAPVTLAVLYGSRARGAAGPGSDGDLAVSFRNSVVVPA